MDNLRQWVERRKNYLQLDVQQFCNFTALLTVQVEASVWN